LESAIFCATALPKPNPPETRLWGDLHNPYPNGNQRRTRLMAAELSHAMHFSLLSSTERTGIRWKYLGFILGSIASGRNGTHIIGERTSPLVAFIESLDHFSHRFFEFYRSRNEKFPNVVPDATDREAYVEAELNGTLTGNAVAPLTNDFAAPSLTQVASIDPNTSEVVPTNLNSLHGKEDEGAIFGGIILDLAKHRSLEHAIGSILRSKKLTFDDYLDWYMSRAVKAITITREIVDIRTRWNL